jgi:hypothetical protein
MTSDPLENLSRIGLLDAVPFSAESLQKMLSVAQSRLQDAMRADNSMETRFDCAYTAIRAVQTPLCCAKAIELRQVNLGITKRLCSVWCIPWMWIRQRCAFWTVCENKET